MAKKQVRKNQTKHFTLKRRGKSSPKPLQNRKYKRGNIKYDITSPEEQIVTSGGKDKVLEKIRAENRAIRRNRKKNKIEYLNKAKRITDIDFMKPYVKYFAIRVKNTTFMNRFDDKTEGALIDFFVFNYNIFFKHSVVPLETKRKNSKKLVEFIKKNINKRKYITIKSTQKDGRVKLSDIMFGKTGEDFELIDDIRLMASDNKYTYIVFNIENMLNNAIMNINTNSKTSLYTWYKVPIYTDNILNLSYHIIDWSLEDIIDLEYGPTNHSFIICFFIKHHMKYDTFEELLEKLTIPRFSINYATVKTYITEP